MIPRSARPIVAAALTLAGTFGQMPSEANAQGSLRGAVRALHRKLRGPERERAIQGIRDPRVRSAAQLVDKYAGEGKNEKVTERHLGAARKMLEKHDKGRDTPLSAREARIMRGKLDALQQELRPPSSKEHRPFATAVKVKAIRDPDVRKAAERLAGAYGEGSEELNLTELNKAREAIRKHEKDGKPLPEALSPLDAEKQIEPLVDFFMTGTGGLVSEQRVTIDGRRFKEAFPLAGDPTSSEILADYEKQFERSGYDRIYIKDREDNLYVVLNETGDLKVKPEMRVQVGEKGDYEDSWRVVRVSDVINSRAEATYLFWGDVVERVVKTIRSQLGKSLDEDVNNVADQNAQAAQGQSKNNRKLDPKQALLGLSAAAAFTTAAFNLKASLAVLAISAGAVTGFNYLSYLRAKYGRDKKPIYHAVGVTPNRKERTIY